MGAPSSSSPAAGPPTLALTGGKGASLARLMRAGVSRSARLRHHDRPHSANPWMSARRLIDGDGLDAARRHCLAWDMPGTPEPGRPRRVRRLDQGPVAVRSSLVCEDSASVSCAGLLDTVLDVDGEPALLEAVRRDSRLRVRRPAVGLPRQGRRRRASASSVCLAVVVQRMVEASSPAWRSASTRSPAARASSSRRSPGLGENLAQGRVRPDRYRVGPRGELQEALPARHGAPLLDEPLARRLAELVVSIADAAEAPQDVEWSYRRPRLPSAPGPSHHVAVRASRSTRAGWSPTWLPAS